jgi:hypothetical protein
MTYESRILGSGFFLARKPENYLQSGDVLTHAIISAA